MSGEFLRKQIQKCKSHDRNQNFSWKKLYALYRIYPHSFYRSHDTPDIKCNYFFYFSAYFAETRFILCPAMNLYVMVREKQEKSKESFNNNACYMCDVLGVLYKK